MDHSAIGGSNQGPSWPLAFALVGLLFITTLAGCMGSDPNPVAVEEPREGLEVNEGPAENLTAEEDESEDPGESEETSGNATDDVGDHEWPPIEEAKIGPGAFLELLFDDDSYSSCTTNFVFTSPVDGSIYIGTAAHCVEMFEIGDSLTIREGNPRQVVIQVGDDPGESVGAIVAYSGWWTGTEYDSFHGNDFALLEINETDKGKVHPGVRHYGGPTGLAGSEDVEILDRVLWYGHSSFRSGLEPIRPNEGVLCETSDDTGDGTVTIPEAFLFAPIGPVIWGDSGSPVMTEDGRALGLAEALFYWPVCGHVVTSPWLQLALEEARERGFDVELATWPLLTDSRLPDGPD